MSCRVMACAVDVCLEIINNARRSRLYMHLQARDGSEVWLCSFGSAMCLSRALSF
jgi:hypothetical protein